MQSLERKIPDSFFPKTPESVVNLFDKGLCPNCDISKQGFTSY